MILAFLIVAQCILADLGGFVICATPDIPVVLNVEFTEMPGSGFTTYYRLCRDAFPTGPVPGTDLVCVSEERTIDPRDPTLWPWITCEVPAEMGRTQGAIVNGFEYGFALHHIELDWDGTNVIVTSTEGSLPMVVLRGLETINFYDSSGDCSYTDSASPEGLTFYSVE